MLTLVMPCDAKPACNSPEHRALVDAAFDHVGGPEAQQLRERVCPGCPVRAECLALAMVDGEYGPWAGTSSKVRTHLGAPSAAKGRNIARVHHGVRKARVR